MKANSKKPNKYLTIFGVILICIGLGFFFSFLVNAEIKSAISENIPDNLKAEGYKINLSKASSGYLADIYFSAEDDRFEYAPICGLVGTKFIGDMKKNSIGIDQRIMHYNFYFSANSKNTFSSTYSNNSNYNNEIKIELLGENSEAKSYEEFLNDSKMIRNLQSTLMQYQDEYYSNYFLFDNALITFNNRKAFCDLTFKNTSEDEFESVYIFYDYIDTDGITLKQSIDSIHNVKPGKLLNLEFNHTFSYSENLPDSFRIKKIIIFYYEKTSIEIVFD